MNSKEILRSRHLAAYYRHYIYSQCHTDKSTARRFAWHRGGPTASSAVTRVCPLARQVDDFQRNSHVSETPWQWHTVVAVDKL